MSREKPVLHCFAAPTLPDGRVRGTPILVSLEDAEWLFKDKQWAIVGPDPEDCHALAEWERAQEPLPRST